MNDTLRLQIRIDPLTGPGIASLLRAHLQEMALHSPPESIHALDLDRLRQPGITFWSAWNGDELLGCIALKQLDARHGEIKSMRTAPERRGQGIGAALLQHLLAEARGRGYRRLSLETGSMAAFEPAHRLYAAHGFTFSGPFADYIEDPNSTFMTLAL